MSFHSFCLSSWLDKETCTELKQLKENAELYLAQRAWSSSPFQPYTFTNLATTEIICWCPCRLSFMSDLLHVLLLKSQFLRDLVNVCSKTTSQCIETNFHTGFFLVKSSTWSENERNKQPIDCLYPKSIIHLRRHVFSKSIFFVFPNFSKYDGLIL